MTTQADPAGRINAARGKHSGPFGRKSLVAG
jgi:hypothetical protein